MALAIQTLATESSSQGN